MWRKQLENDNEIIQRLILASYFSQAQVQSTDLFHFRSRQLFKPGRFLDQNWSPNAANLVVVVVFVVVRGRRSLKKL